MFLFWKTNMLYYVKTDKIFKNMNFELEAFKFYFDISKLNLDKVKKNRTIYFEFDKKEKDNKLFFSAINAQESESKREELLKKIKLEGVEISESLLLKSFKIFKKQTEIDYFINKNVKEFLKEQFNLWMFQYIFSEENEWSNTRIRELQILKNIAFKLIDFLSQFENELIKVWNKPKFVLNSNYVITLNKIAEKNIDLIKKILKHENFSQQNKEWKDLELISEDVDINKLLVKDLEGFISLNPKLKYLPIDTIHFKSLEIEILSIFENLDKDLDGWLIKSENYQALLTILPKFKEKIQTIYIDPPFNTGQDFDYLDNFQDSTWLTFMENRIVKAKDILNSKGNFFMHLDDNANYLGKFLLHSIFKPENFRAEISNFLGYNIKHEIQSEKFNEQSEIILHYSKGKDYVFNKLVKIKDKFLAGAQGQNEDKIKNDLLDIFKNLLIDPTDIDFFHDGLFQAYSPNLIMKTEKVFRNEKTETIIKDILLPIWENEEFHLKKIFKTVETNVEEEDKYFIDVIGNIWLDIFSFRYSNINRGENQSFSTQKAEKLLARIILASSEINDIILDFFLGSGTTCAVAQKLKRKWIGIESGEQFNEVVLPRMKRVLAGKEKAKTRSTKVGITKMVNWLGGGFFKYYELEQYEDTLRKMKYQNEIFFKSSESDVYNQYIFMKDQKLSETLEIDYKQNEVKVDFKKIYNKVDIAETLSNLLGKFIKQIKSDGVEFDDGSIINFNKIDYKYIKRLIWW